MQKPDDCDDAPPGVSSLSGPLHRRTDPVTRIPAPGLRLFWHSPNDPAPRASCRRGSSPGIAASSPAWHRDRGRSQYDPPSPAECRPPADRTAPPWKGSPPNVLSVENVLLLLLRSSRRP